MMQIRTYPLAKLSKPVPERLIQTPPPAAEPEVPPIKPTISALDAIIVERVTNEEA
jgi:hypothetical protein